ncbi:hypothetical protein [Cellulomonas sp. ES6]|uniref:hypothetical protein n=1 Tax=Cellulomonas sp. ES6 TaxID=3039384 RepID=UPI0024B7FAB9|nr:hypothetical protein [Cellulomonas sp. ES6]WHP16458.1 hypothetical protein P9841_12615 [Cellulomonas sp. ES6]
MIVDEVATLKLSEVARRCGVQADILRRLAEDDLLPGAVRAPTGHVYLREDSVPSWTFIVELLEARLQTHLRRSEAALARVQVEIEALTAAPRTGAQERAAGSRADPR